MVGAALFILAFLSVFLQCDGFMEKLGDAFSGVSGK